MCAIERHERRSARRHGSEMISGASCLNCANILRGAAFHVCTAFNCRNLWAG